MLAFFCAHQRSHCLYISRRAKQPQQCLRPPGAAKHPLVYFHSEDCVIPTARIKALGDSISDEKTSIAPYGFTALANDTQGNMFGLHSMKQFHPAHAKGRAL